ncbi:hypothetical protein ASPTUDRAFT_38329, partial [Aspergillus tubingensis CBS 134.48]
MLEPLPVLVLPLLSPLLLSVSISLGFLPFEEEDDEEELLLSEGGYLLAIIHSYAAWHRVWN